MAVDDEGVVDWIASSPKTNEVILVITDHLQWNTDNDFHILHMELLLEKVNSYLGFMESGEIYEAYPEAIGKKLVIRVVAKYEMSEDGKTFFEKLKDAVEKSRTSHRVQTSTHVEIVWWLIAGGERLVPVDARFAGKRSIALSDFNEGL